MVAKIYSRQEVLSRLQAQVKGGKAILVFGAGTGLTARCAEIGGADLIGVYSTAHFRMQGKPSLLAWLPYSDANTQTLVMAKEILPVVKETPCIVGVGAHDPNLDLNRYLNEMVALGFSGITNEPFVGMYGPVFAKQLEDSGLGFSRELELISLANQKDIFTLAWAFNSWEAQRMAEVGADVIGAMVGVTSGGLTGGKEGSTVDWALEEVQQICVAARKVKPEIMVLTHGGPFKDVESARYSVEKTGAVGYVAGSSGERIPTEQAVVGITKAYKEIEV